jgi:hypothetical protein
MNEIFPAPGYALVQLGDYYTGVKLPEAKYDTKTEGVILKINPGKDQPWARTLVGYKAFWPEFVEGKRVNFEGKQQCFIRIADLQGWEKLTEVNHQQGKPFSSY